jgi:hypothetical protein
VRRGSARVPKRVLEITAFRMKFWLCTVWEENFVPIKPYLHLKRARCAAHASDIDFDLRKPVLLQYQIETTVLKFRSSRPILSWKKIKMFAFGAAGLDGLQKLAGGPPAVPPADME